LELAKTIAPNARFDKTCKFCMINFRKWDKQQGNNGNTLPSFIVTLLFQQLDVDARAIQMNYVGVLKDIMQLNYGLVNTSTILFSCEWIKHTNNWGSIYIKDDACVNFKHKLLVF
jgi:hypothetical protein